MIVLDTHVALWTVEADPRMGKQARDRIQTEADRDGVIISAISIWEIAMLSARGRIRLPQDIKSWVDALLALPGIIYEPLRPDVAVNCHHLPGDFHKDPSDRLIVATARFHGVPLVTADKEILAYAAAGHLQAIDARL